MTSNRQILLMLLGIALFASVSVSAVIFMEFNKKAGTSDAILEKYASKYNKLYDNPFVRSEFRRIATMVTNMFVYTDKEAKMVAVKWFRMSFGALGCFILVTTLIYRSIYIELLLILFGFIVYSVFVRDRANAVYFDMTKQASAAVGSLTEFYSQKSSIPIALGLCRKGPLVKRVFDRILEVIEATDRDTELELFLDMKPYRLFQTLMSACYIMSDGGDVILKDGSSAFTNSLDRMKADIDREIRKLQKIKLMFGIIKYLPVISLAGMPLIKKFFMAEVPGTTYMYMGMYGSIITILIVLLALIGYWVISVITDSQITRVDDRLNFIDRLLENKIFYKFIKSIEPHKTRAREATTKRLQGCLSQKDITYLTASKFLSGVTALVCSVIAFITIPILYKNFTYNNIQAASLDGASQFTLLQEQQLFELDCKYLASSPRWSEDALQIQIKSNVTGLIDLQVLEQMDRMISKYDTYHSIRFKPYYILLIDLIVFIGSQMPTLILLLRKRIVKSEADVDVMQMETLIMILMHTNIDTLEMLKWLYRTSSIHSSILLTCYQTYPADPEKALDELAMQAATPSFQSLVERLCTTAFDQSLEQAFHGLAIDREHRARMLELVDDASLKKKRRLASKFALAPIIVLAVFYFLVPIGYVSITSFIKEFSQMQGGLK